MFGRTIRQGVCPDCGGTGRVITDKCPECKGKGSVRKETTLTLNIPAGVDTNSYMKKKGYGQAAQGGGQAGDLIVVFKVEPHKIFVRNGFDLQVDLPISFKTAALGGTVKVPSIDDTFDFTIPEGTQNGQFLPCAAREPLGAGQYGQSCPPCTGGSADEIDSGAEAGRSRNWTRTSI